MINLIDTRTHTHIKMVPCSIYIIITGVHREFQWNEIIFVGISAV